MPHDDEKPFVFELPETPSSPSDDWSELGKVKDAESVDDDVVLVGEIGDKTKDDGEPSEPQKKGRRSRNPFSNIDALFSEKGIGVMWASGWSALYRSWGAPELDADERKMMAQAFAAWATARLPKDASKYQPEFLLLFSMLLPMVPRHQIVVERTLPFWKLVSIGGQRVWRLVTSPFRRREEEP